MIYKAAAGCDLTALVFKAANSIIVFKTFYWEDDLVIKYSTGGADDLAKLTQNVLQNTTGLVTNNFKTFKNQSFKVFNEILLFKLKL